MNYLDVKKLVWRITGTLAERRQRPRGYYLTALEWFEERGAAAGAELTWCHSKENVSRRGPVCVDSLPHWMFSENMERELPGAYVLSIPHGRLLGANGAVITPDGFLLGDVSFEFYRHPARHRVFDGIPPVARDLSQAVGTVVSCGAQTYYHWVLDALPRLGMLMNMGRANMCIAVPAAGGFHGETLRLCGVEEGNLLVLDARSHLRAEELLVPSLIGHVGEPPLWSCECIRALLSADSGCSVAETIPRRLYLSRARAAGRKVSNEDAVLAALKSKGFSEVVLEEMPVKRQIALFANAEWVVGPHGGGFANLVFCRHGARIVEFFAPQYVNVCYWALACQLGIRYGYVLGRGPHLAAKAYPNDGGANMEVDVPKLLALLERMGMA